MISQPNVSGVTIILMWSGGGALRDDAKKTTARETTPGVDEWIYI